jgi:transcriptional regulator with XRE-family HTH domain
MLNDNSKILALNLIQLRTKLGLTQEEMAKTCELSYRQYQVFESGKGNPTLKSISHLANTYQVSLRKLLSLSHIRLDIESDIFLNNFKEKFSNVNLGARIRTPEGVILWGNEVIEKAHKQNYHDGPVDLLETLPLEAKTLFKAHLSLEMRGISNIFSNFVHTDDGNFVCIEVYTVLIYPKKGNSPIYSVAYITETEKSLEENYFKFCNQLLRCI